MARQSILSRFAINILGCVKWTPHYCCVATCNTMHFKISQVIGRTRILACGTSRCTRSHQTLFLSIGGVARKTTLEPISTANHSSRHMYSTWIWKQSPPTILAIEYKLPNTSLVSVATRSIHKRWSPLYLLYWHPRQAILIPFTSIYYKKWVFTFVNYKLVKKSTANSGLGQAIKVDFSENQVIKGVF